MENLKLESDFIVVGSGIAGLRAGIDLAEAGRVLVLTKTEISESNSAYAQGGIAAAVGPNDSPGRHYADTIAAGAGLSEPEAVRVLVEEGPLEIGRLLEWGADFERDGQSLSLSREGGHSVARVVHGNGGLTGRAVIDALLAKARSSSNMTIIPFTFLRDLLVVDGRVVGLQFQRTDEIVSCYAACTLIATGGGSQVFRENTNPGTATGDGLAAAYRAGALLRDMEFVQFHPTALNVPGAPRFLLTEALRGDGARIVDERGERFVDELKTRDEVSRTIYRQVAGRPGAKVFLDVTQLALGTIRGKFRHVYETCRQYGLDITKDRIPITPAAHYFMGGIYTDLQGRSSLPGLYAAGEAASTGVHGGNRLASNSLLEALVYGGRAARAMRAHVPPVSRSAVMPASAEAGSVSCFPANEIRERIREITWLCAGLVRDEKGLQGGAAQLGALQAILPEAQTIDEVTARNLLTVAGILHEAALARTESRGAHYRQDFPAAWPLRVHSYIQIGEPVEMRDKP